MSDKPKLGEILVQAGIIDDMQLSSALGEQARWGRRLGVTLIKMGMVEEGHLVRALAKQLGLPVASLAGKRIVDDVLALVPARIATKHGVIPLFVKDGTPRSQLYLGMEDPSNLAVLDDLGFRTGMTIQPVMVGPTEIGEAMDRYYLGKTGPEPIEISSPTPTPTPTPGAPPRPTATPTATPAPAPIPRAEAIGELNLRRIAKDEDTAPTPSREDEPDRTTSPVEASPAVVPPVPSDGEVDGEPAAAPAPAQAASIPPAPADLPDGLLEEVARAIDETERTRAVARAIAQLMIEKGLITLEELQERIARQKQGASN